MRPRYPSWEGKLFRDDEGRPLEGQHLVPLPDGSMAIVCFAFGLVHETEGPAVEFPTARCEYWKSGHFLKATQTRFSR